MRTTPVRFYNTKEAGIAFKPENDPEKDRHWPPTDYTNYPTPDTVPHSPEMPEYLTGVDLYEYDPERRHPNRLQDKVKENAALEEKAIQFWQEYQAAHPADVNQKYDIHDFADIFAEQNKMDAEKLVDLMAYMYARGFIQPSTLRSVIDHLTTKSTTLNTRTHFNNK